MTLSVVGCSHQNTPIEIRERLAFAPTQLPEAFELWAATFPEIEAVILSTCNRVELYTAAENGTVLTPEQVAGFFDDFHRRSGSKTPVETIQASSTLEHLYQYTGSKAVEHLFKVSSSLDSMVVGEPQILAQVKQAYQLATQYNATGPLTHAAFQAALRTARRVACQTDIQQHRVSIPSVAVADFAQQIFESFDNKTTLVIGAGQMAEETLNYLRDQGARDLIVANRSEERARDLAMHWRGRVAAWEDLDQALAEADLVVTTTAATEPIITVDEFAAIQAARGERPLFILDLAVPRDFDPAVGDLPGVYLYSVDDLKAVCEKNRQRRKKELPAAQRIIAQATEQFIEEQHHRATGPVIQQLRDGWQKPKEDELRRLFNKLPDLSTEQEDEIRQSFDRLINKLLHAPLESLRYESRHGIPSALVEALSKLFRLKD
ncbi:MAG: glutamyl-tRNA reductase [Pirellulales bacterium]|nr:glutamyl-tRNA reductase [Pirellulales bacterium]